MNTRNNVGPSTVPWGTPDVTWEHMEASPSTTTLWILLLRNASILHSTARVFADDCVIYRPIHTEKDHQLMQEDLDTLVGWSDTRQMQFNVSKCAIMQTTNKRSKTDFPYKVKGETLQKVDHQPYLGVELSNNLKYNWRWNGDCLRSH
jgi:hypothetical protein